MSQLKKYKLHETEFWNWDVEIYEAEPVDAMRTQALELATYLEEWFNDQTDEYQAAQRFLKEWGHEQANETLR